MQMEWFKIWYSDGEVIGTTQEDWQQAPEDNVIAVYEFLGRNSDGIPLAMTHSGSDWYWLAQDGRVGQNGASTMMVGHWLDHDAPPGAILKRGVWVSQERLDQSMQELRELIASGP